MTAGFVLLAGSGCHSSPSTPDLPNPTTAVTAPGGGQIRVVETGFHMTKPYPGNGETNRAIAAVVVENTSKTMEAEGPRLSIRFLDASGASVFTQGQGDEYDIGLPWIQPGQRVGIGFILVTTDKQSANRTVVTMRTEVGTSYWHAPHSGLQVTTRDLHVQPRPDGAVELNYTATIKDPARAKASDLSFKEYLLLRDAAGKLIGGWSIGRLHPNTTDNPATFQDTVTADQWKINLPADADLSRSEISAVYGSE